MQKYINHNTQPNCPSCGKLKEPQMVGKKRCLECNEKAKLKRKLKQKEKRKDRQPKGNWEDQVPDTTAYWWGVGGYK